MKKIFFLFSFWLFIPDVYSCTEFGNKMKDCTVYSCTFKHPFTKTDMKRTIKGIVDGKCQTEEEMPNNGKMNCNFPKEKWAEIADFYSSSGVKNVDYMNKAMNDGTCIVTGY